jgi:hypothetical protein
MNDGGVFDEIKELPDKSDAGATIVYLYKFRDSPRSQVVLGNEEMRAFK